LQVEVIRLLVSNYFDIVRSNLADLVPKALMRFLVHHSQRGLQQHLIATLYRWGKRRQLGCLIIDRRSNV
jgi:dynamin 1-like protein